MGGEDEHPEERKRRRLAIGLDSPAPDDYPWDTLMLLVAMHIALMWNWTELVYQKLAQLMELLLIGYFQRHGMPPAD